MVLHPGQRYFHKTVHAFSVLPDSDEDDEGSTKDNGPKQGEGEHDSQAQNEATVEDGKGGSASEPQAKL